MARHPTITGYAIMWSISSHGVHGAGWLVVGAALALDIATVVGWRRLAR